MSIIFGQESIKKLDDYKTFRECNGCISLFQENAEIFTICVNSKKGLKYVYNTCFECERQAGVNLKKIAGKVSIYCGPHIVCEKSTDNVSTQRELFVFLLQPLFQRLQDRQNERTSCCVLQHVPEDILFLIQSFL
jgi:hypothetical protein